MRREFARSSFKVVVADAPATPMTWRVWPMVAGACFCAVIGLSMAAWSGKLAAWPWRTAAAPTSLISKDVPFGEVTAQFIERPVIPEDVLATAPADLSEALRLAAWAIPQGNAVAVLARLQRFDDREPVVIYLRAVALLWRGHVGDTLAAMRMLSPLVKRNQGFALTLRGIMQLRLVILDERGKLAAADRMVLGDDDRAVSRTRAELAREAVQWLQRAAELGHAEASVYLGFVEARGLLTAPDASAAVAHWRAAAEKGHGLAHHELGRAYYFGGGVVADRSIAVQHFSKSIHYGLLEAHLLIAKELVKEVERGDQSRVPEIRAHLATYIGNTNHKDRAGHAYYLLGSSFSAANTGKHLDPKKALAYWHAGAALGDDLASMMLIRYYHAGVGVPEDKALAWAMLRDLSKTTNLTSALKTFGDRTSPTAIAKAETITAPFALPAHALDILGATGFVDCAHATPRLHGTAEWPFPGRPINGPYNPANWPAGVVRDPTNGTGSTSCRN